VSDHYGKAAVGASLVHFLFGKALNAVVSLMTLVLLARWMPQEGYGVYIAFLALQSSLLALSNLGIDTTTERYMPEFRTRYADDKLLGFVSTALGARFVSLALLTLIVWFAAAPITTLVGVQAYRIRCGGIGSHVAPAPGPDLHERLCGDQIGVTQLCARLCRT
jgi:O-antigen/teichoic acid export membrane protein